MAKFSKREQNIELAEKLVYVGRCVKVVKGGRRFRFSVVVVVGDKRGRVGVGIGKAAEVTDARSKASNAAKKAMVKIPLRNGRTLHHDVISKFCSGKVIMKSASAGTGIIAGGAIRSLFEVLGIRDVVAKSIGSTNPYSMLASAMAGLTSINYPKFIADKRGKKISELFSNSEHIVTEDERKTENFTGIFDVM